MVDIDYMHSEIDNLDWVAISQALTLSRSSHFVYDVMWSDVRTHEVIMVASMRTSIHAGSMGERREKKSVYSHVQQAMNKDTLDSDHLLSSHMGKNRRLRKKQPLIPNSPAGVLTRHDEKAEDQRKVLGSSPPRAVKK